MITYKFNNTTGILETTFEGKITVVELIDYIESVRDDNTLPKKLKIFSDGSNGKFATKVNPKELKQFLDINKVTLKQKDYIYDAYVVSGSVEMALGMLYKNLIRIKNYKFNIFSTKEAALDWLNKF
ncbi:MAG: hypothetical protein KAR57_04785 [Bacteroidales bacterium]|nr:hypothetical protein [Bacteroidales bacterium]